MREEEARREQLSVQVELGGDADAGDIDEEVLRLRRTLLQLDVSEVRRAPAPQAPDATRTADAPLLGALLVAASAGTIPAVVRTIQAWLGHREDRHVRLRLGDDEIELTGSTADQERALIDAFLARHSTRS